DDHEVGVAEIALVVAAEPEGDGEPPELLDRFAQLGLALGVGDGDLGAGADEEAGHAQAAAEEAEAHDGDAPALDRRNLAAQRQDHVIPWAAGISCGAPRPARERLPAPAERPAPAPDCRRPRGGRGG